MFRAPELPIFHSHSLLCAASFGGGRAAIRAGILFPPESEVLGTQSWFPIAPHLILGGSIISMAGGLEWRDGIRVDTEAWCLASIQFQSEETIPLLRTLWDAPRPELRLHFRFPCLIRFYSNPCKLNWCKHPQNNHSYENIWLKNPYQKKNGEVKEILNSNKREWFLAVFSVRQDKRVCFSVNRYLLSSFFAFSGKEILDSI